MDLLIVDGRRILPIEIKCGAALDPRALADLRQCMQDLSLTRELTKMTYYYLSVDALNRLVRMREEPQGGEGGGYR